MEMRDGITIFDRGVELEATPSGEGFAIVQKKVQVQRGMRHKIEHADFFIDSPGQGYDSATFYLTPQPIILTDMNAPGLFAPPEFAILPAYNENVLYKSKFSARELGGFGSNEFPNTFLAARPTFNFYADTLYLTILFNGRAGELIENFMCTMYAALDSKPIDAVEHGIGLIKEQHGMLCSRLDVLGRSIPAVRNTGQIAPFYLFGSTRPERMIAGDTLLNYFLNMADRDDEFMSDTGVLRGRVRAARRMVENPEAFGGGTGVTATPDWIRLHLNEGLMSGPLRAQWPPIKHDDNGNVLCL